MFECQLAKQQKVAMAIIGVLVGAVVFNTIGCTRGTLTEGAKPRFAFVVNVPTDRFWDIAYAGCLKAAAEEDVIVEFHAPNEATAQQQKQIVESLMSRGLDGLAISPLNPDSLALVLDEAAKMFPVICQDSDAPESQRACYIGTDNVDLGRKMGDLLKQALPNGGKVALFVGQLDVENAQERQRGVLQSLEGSNLEVIGTFTDGAQPAEAKRVVTDVVAKNPDLSGIVGLWGYNAPQAANALANDPNRNIKIVGSDESIETFRAIQQGQQIASVAQRPFDFGYRSIKMLAALHRGEQPMESDDDKIFVDTYVISKDNLEETEQSITEKLALLGELKRYGNR